MSVDIFCLCSHYTDLASLGPIAHYTCGQVKGHLSVEASQGNLLPLKALAAVTWQQPAVSEALRSRGAFLDGAVAMCAACAVH